MWFHSRTHHYHAWVINPAVGCHYFPPGLQLPPQPLRGMLPILLLGEQRHDGCEQFAWDCYPTASRLRFEPGPFYAWVQHANHSAIEPLDIISIIRPAHLLDGLFAVVGGRVAVAERRSPHGVAQSRKHTDTRKRTDGRTDRQTDRSVLNRVVDTSPARHPRRPPDDKLWLRADTWQYFLADFARWQNAGGSLI